LGGGLSLFGLCYYSFMVLPAGRRRYLRGRIYLHSFLAIFLLVIGFLILRRGGPGSGWETYKNDELGVELEYPESFAIEELTEEDREAKIVFKAIRGEPNALFSLRYEDRLGLLRMTGGTVLEALIAAVNRRYPDRFPEYKKEKYSLFWLTKRRRCLNLPISVAMERRG